jgi:hypothetical protein
MALAAVRTSSSMVIVVRIKLSLGASNIMRHASNVGHVTIPPVRVAILRAAVDHGKALSPLTLIHPAVRARPAAAFSGFRCHCTPPYVGRTP